MLPDQALHHLRRTSGGGGQGKHSPRLPTRPTPKVNQSRRRDGGGGTADSGSGYGAQRARAKAAGRTKSGRRWMKPLNTGFWGM